VPDASRAASEVDREILLDGLTDRQVVKGEAMTSAP
jgi:hypothetical protein